MELGLLVIFMVGGSWLYASALLALTDWRWNLGRVVAFGLLGGLSIWPALNGPDDFRWLAGLGGLFCLTVVAPHFLSKRIKALTLAGDIQQALRLELFNGILTFQSVDAGRSRLREAHRIIRHDWSGVGAAAKEEWLQRFRSAWSRRGHLVVWIEGLVHIRENERAVGLFEENFRPGRLRPNATLLYMMVAPYAKLGDIGHALECFRHAERGGSLPGRSFRRSVALLHILAFAGRPDSVDRLISRTYMLQATLPPAFAALWRGVALMRRGDIEAARAEVEKARDYPAINRRVLDGMVRRYTAMLSEPAGPFALDSALEKELDDLESLEMSARPELLPLETGRIISTPGIMIACAAIFLTMGFGTTSTDAFELIRYGANVPSLVKAGEWWRLISSIFLHVGLLHLVFNMWACHIFGSFVERTTGRLSVFVGFLVAGITGSAASAFLGEHMISAGASGGVFGLLGMAIIIALSRRKVFGEMGRVQLMTFLFFAGMNAAYGLMQPQVDNLAHAGGLVGGLAVGMLVKSWSGPRWKALALRIAAAGLAALLALTAVNMVENIRSGGYPRKITSWRTVNSAQNGWTIEAPALWKTVADLPGEMKFSGPLESKFRIVELPATGPASPKEEAVILAKRAIKAHGMEYQELVLSVRTPNGPVGRFVFLVEQEGRVYQMELECDEEMLPIYRPLAERMPLTFKAEPGEQQPAGE